MRARGEAGACDVSGAPASCDHTFVDITVGIGDRLTVDPMAFAVLLRSAEFRVELRLVKCRQPWMGPCMRSDFPAVVPEPQDLRPCHPDEFGLVRSSSPLIDPGPA